MIDSIKVKNYKAFKQAEVKIKPLTVLLGANSVGKSSILQLFLLLKQTATFGMRTDKSPFKMYGPFVNMGSVSNLFYFKNEKIPIEFSISFRNAQLQIWMNKQLTKFIHSFSSIPFLLPIKGLMDLHQNTEAKDRGSFYKLVKGVCDVLRKQHVDKYRDTLRFLFTGNTEISESDIDNFSLENIMKIYDFLELLRVEQKKISSTCYTINFIFNQKAGNLIVSGLSFYIADEEIFSLYENEGFVARTNGNFLSKEDTIVLEKAFVKKASIFGCLQPSKMDETRSSIANYIAQIAVHVLDVLKDEFNPSRIQHVKPLRANPQRYYVIDDEKLTPYVSSLDGDRVIEILRDNETVREDVKKWLGVYGFSLKIEQSEDVIHHIKIIQNGLELDIPDVGFGFSQLLPILVQSKVSPKNSITIIEQPEIHLHPKMQADVADLFINSTSRDNPFIIETHSEYFLRRIRRRVATGRLSSEDVAIYLFTGSNDESISNKVERLDMTSTGSFKWPSDYYDGELYKDLVEYITAQTEL